MRDVVYDVMIIGAGPAGLFAAERLAMKGMRVVVLDAGKPMEQRECPKKPSCDCLICDILEGAGGAGGFSDGKKTYSLTRGTQMENLFSPEHEPILWEIDDTILRYTSSPGVWVDPPTDPPDGIDLSAFSVGAYPLRHIGSDGVREFILNYVQRLSDLGVVFRMGCSVVTLNRGKLIRAASPQRGLLASSHVVIIATGLQGWPWAERTMSMWGVPVTTGPASIGLRYEAPSSYFEELVGWFYDYKLQQGNLRSFCCNHQGQVINETHRTLSVRNVNGDSFLDPSRRTEMSNLAILAKLPTKAPVRAIARCVNSLADGHTAVQRAGDFLAGQPTALPPRQRTNRQSRWGVDIGSAFPEGLRRQFCQFIRDFETALGIPPEAGVIYAPELKYAGYCIPVDRDFRLESGQEDENVYVVGNATGVIDSFVAAALSGIIAAISITGGR